MQLRVEGFADRVNTADAGLLEHIVKELERQLHGVGDARARSAFDHDAVDGDIGAAAAAARESRIPVQILALNSPGTSGEATLREATSAAKHAVVGFTRAMAAEAVGSGITVTVGHSARAKPSLVPLRSA